MRQPVFAGVFAKPVEIEATILVCEETDLAVIVALDQVHALAVKVMRRFFRLSASRHVAR